MSLVARMITSRRGRNVECIAPALVLLAEGAPAIEAAEQIGVSAATILNWMDWAWKHRRETENYLVENCSHLTGDQMAALWARIARRRAKRERRSDFGTAPRNGA
jgi:hypothetical protein